MRTLLLGTLMLVGLGLSAQVAVEIEPMLESRESHQAARIDDSKALVAGGWNGNEITSTAEYYDVTAEMWFPVESMGTARTNFAMCDLNNGYVIAAGGWDGVDPLSLASTEIYDFDNDVWMAGPDLSVGRSYLRSTKLDDGRILFTGGYDGTATSAACDIYDPVANTMTAVASMNNARSSHVAVLMADGRVMVAGGYNPDLGFQMVETEIYDPFLDTWTSLNDLNTGRDYAAGVVNDSGIMAIVGGRFFNGDLNLFQGLASAEVFEPFTGSWIEVAIPAGHSYNHLLSFANGSIYSVSGTDETGSGVTTTYSSSMSFSIGVSTTVEVIDAEDDGDQRYQSAAAQLNGDMWLVCGGDDAGIGSAELWMMPDNVEEAQEVSVTAFPNPCVDKFVLSGYRNYQWRMVDLNGRVALEGNGNVVNVESLPAGQYVLISLEENLPFQIAVQVIH